MSRPWYKIGTVPGAPEIPFFEGDSAFVKYFELSNKSRIIGLISWYDPIPIECIYSFTKIATHSVAIGFLLSLLGTIVLIFGQVVLFAGMFSCTYVHVNFNMMDMIHHSVICFGDNRYSPRIWVPYRSMFSSFFSHK